MKKTIVVFCAFILVMMLGACQPKERLYISEYGEIKPNDAVQMTIKPDTLTDKELVLVIENLTDNEGSYGVEFALEKKNGKEWYVQNTEQAFNAIGVILEPKGVNELTALFEKNLSKGDYRIVKNIYIENGVGDNKIVLACEFNVK